MIIMIGLLYYETRSIGSVTRDLYVSGHLSGFHQNASLHNDGFGNCQKCATVILLTGAAGRATLLWCDHVTFQPDGTFRITEVLLGAHVF